jgi:hypothetical protein
MTEGAGHDASLASDTEIFVDDDPVVEFGLSVAGLGGAHFKAVGLFTVIADHGEVDSYMLPLDHFNPGATRIARPSMKDRADEFALTASCTLLLIND